MRVVQALLLGAVLVAASAAAADDIDLIAGPIEITGGSLPGTANIDATVSFLVFGTVPAYSSDVELVLDGVVYGGQPITTWPHEAVGCTYYPDWQGLGPACIDDPDCSLYGVNGGYLPGECTLAAGYTVPVYCGCWYDLHVIWTGIYLAGVAMLQVVSDGVSQINELREDNNVATVFAPVPETQTSWGVIKSLYR